MKNIIPAILAFVLFSCGPSKVEKLISDYEQTLDNTKIDLSLKIIDIKSSGYSTCNDSIIRLKSNFEYLKNDKINYLKDQIKSDSILLIKNKKEALDPLTGFIYKASVDLYTENIESSKNYLKVYNSDCKGTFLESYYLKIKDFEEHKDSVLFKIYDCTYSIKNPMLNNVKQTISKTYFISEDESKIIQSISKKI